MTSPQSEPDTSLLDLILGPPGEGAFLTTPGDGTNNRPGYAIAYPNTVEGRAHYMADARTHQANGRNNFLSSVVWDGSVLSDDSLRLTKQTPALYYPTLWADVDTPRELDKGRRVALERRGHIRTRSGTPGRFHLRLPLDVPITDPVEFERLNLQLADALGGVDAAKSYPYMWLTTPGFTRFKPEYPRGKTVMMTSMDGGPRWSGDALRSLFASWGIEERAARTYTGDASIEPEAIDWDALPESVRQNYSMIPLEGDRSEAIWHWWLWCKKRHLSVGQTYYISTALDPEGYIASKYDSDQSIASQISRAYEKAPPVSTTKAPPTDKVSGEKETGMTTGHENDNTKEPYVPDLEEYVVESAAEGEMVLTRWLWDRWVPLGELSLIAGYEESMKSTVCIWVAAQVTKGRLAGEYKGTPKNVLYIATEDSWHGTLRPRLSVAGADMSRVFRMRPSDSKRSYINAVKFIAQIRRVVEEHGIALIVFDPIVSVLGDTNVEKEESLREAIDPIIDMADDLRVGLLGIKHFTKLDSTDPAKLLSGNRAWSLIARATIMVVNDPDSDTGGRIIGVHKSNITKKPVPQRFSPLLRDITIEGVTSEMPTVQWDGDSPYTAQEALEVTHARKRGREREEKPKRPKAFDWLAKFLHDNGPMPRQEVIDANEEELPTQGFGAYSESTLDKAWRDLGDKGLHGLRRTGADGQALWSVATNDPGGEQSEAS